MVGAPDLKSGGYGFKSHSDHLAGVGHTISSKSSTKFCQICHFRHCLHFWTYLKKGGMTRLTGKMGGKAGSENAIMVPQGTAWCDLSQISFHSHL